jgi:ketosteroid isomerase-like protein
VSRENVEIVRRSYEAWNAGAMDVLRECYDPNAEMVFERDGAEAIVGIDALMLLYARLRQAWDTDEMEPTSFTDAGDRVVVRHVWHARGRGRDLDIELAVICTLRHGRMLRVEPFWSHHEALKAAGYGRMLRVEPF